MKRVLAVLCSDQVNRYGIKLTVKSLESAVNQSWDFGMPSNIGHDCTRLVGWSKGLGLYFEPGFVRTLGITLIPDTQEEYEQISRVAQISLMKKLEEQINPHREELMLKVGNYLSKDASPGLIGSAAFYDQGIAAKIFPELFKLKDKDGLIPISNLNINSFGIIEKDGLLLYAHPFFRRSFSYYNTLNSPFFNVLRRLAQNKDLDIKIALDENLIVFLTAKIAVV